MKIGWNIYSNSMAKNSFTIYSVLIYSEISEVVNFFEAKKKKKSMTCEERRS